MIEGSQQWSSIVLVHGLQGHPCRTWTAQLPKAGTTYKSLFRRVAPSRKSWSLFKVSKSECDSPATPASTEVPDGVVEARPSVFWPGDLLPEECPQSRILVYGYDSLVTKFMAGPTNQNTIFSHGKDLLFALCRDRPVHRPVLFVAHSLGGIVVKEVKHEATDSSKPLLS